MPETQVMRSVEISELQEQVQYLADQGFRLIQMHCTPAEKLDIYYSFENQKLELINLKLSVEEGTPIPSISGIFLAAFLYENEMHDLFGISFQGIAVDYQGKLYKTAVKVPFGRMKKNGEER